MSLGWRGITTHSLMLSYTQNRPSRKHVEHVGCLPSQRIFL